MTFDHIDPLLNGPDWTAIIYSYKYRYGKEMLTLVKLMLDKDDRDNP